jgi:hypothetical protein
MNPCGAKPTWASRSGRATTTSRRSGLHSEGKTRKETLEDIREAIPGYLEAFPVEGPRLGLLGRKDST